MQNLTDATLVSCQYISYVIQGNLKAAASRADERNRNKAVKTCSVPTLTSPYRGVFFKGKGVYCSMIKVGLQLSLLLCVLVVLFCIIKGASVLFAFCMCVFVFIVGIFAAFIAKLIDPNL